MSDNLRDRIAAVLNRHKTADVYDEWADCQCGHVGTRWDDHVADAVIEALNLRPDQVGTLTRHVTEWTDNG